MKVNITLTVGGTDVIIDYAEGKALFKDLKALFEPANSSEPFSIFENGSMVKKPTSGCQSSKSVAIDEDIEKAIKTIEDTPEPEFMDPEDIPTLGDSEINTEIVDTEIAERMKHMQAIIDKMNK